MFRVDNDVSGMHEKVPCERSHCAIDIMADQT